MRSLSFAVRTILVLFAVPSLAVAQSPAPRTARIVGRVVDVRTGEGIANVGVQVVGAPAGAQTGLDGRYAISRVAPGTVTLHVRRLGFGAKTVTGIVVREGETLEQDIGLEPVTVTLSTTVVTAAAERGTVGEALDQQRTSTNVVNAVTREQIARSPDGDAAQAVQRVSGVTVQDGKYVFVRGLGERYTTTSLNGARMPSPEPERKVVPLDLFPASLLQSVTTVKNFTPDQPGDFSGAQVDIRTREFPAHRQLQFSASTGVNSRARGATLPLPHTLSGDRFGIAGSERQLPAVVAEAGDFRTAPSQSQINQMVGSFRNAWAPRLDRGGANTSLGTSIGGTASLLGARLGYVGSASYSHAYEVRDQEVRAFALGGASGTTEIDHFEGQTGRASVLWGGLFNAMVALGGATQISLNNTYNRSADNEARRETGYSENLAQRLQVDRQRFVERSVYSSQVAARHLIGARTEMSASFTASGVRRNEPDRTEFVRVVPQDGSPAYWLDASEGAVKTFGALEENSYATAADLTIGFGSPAREHRIKLGGAYRFTERDASNRVYSIQASGLTVNQRRMGTDELFNGQFTEPGRSVFRIQPLSQGGSYDAQEELGAAYAMADVSVSDRLNVIVGARVERNVALVRSEPTIGSRVKTSPEYTDVLPSLVANFRLTPRQNLRFSASQTLARPEYRELAEVQYRDVIGGENVIGNASLQRTLIRNADIRWEWYPRSGEVLSVGMFAKRFDAPIERVFLATSGTRLSSFVNAEAARTLGVELDVRTDLDLLMPALASVNAFANLTVMSSDVTIGENKYGVTDGNRPMVGQAPYVVNGGLTYAPFGGRVSATALFNRVGRRIVAVSDNQLPPVYERPRNVVDASLRLPVFAGLAAKFDAKNLFDEPYMHTQGSVVRESYRAGRVFTIGFSLR